MRSVAKMLAIDHHVALPLRGLLSVNLLFSFPWGPPEDLDHAFWTTPGGSGTELDRLSVQALRLGVYLADKPHNCGSPVWKLGGGPGFLCPLNL